MPFEVETKRLFIRKVLPEDRDDLLCYGRDPEVNRFILSDFSMSKFERDFAQWSGPWSGEENVHLLFAMVHQQEQKVIGDLVFVWRSKAFERGEIGYRLNTKYQGQGFASEAMRAFLPRVFSHFQLHKLTADIELENKSSIKLIEHLGFQREAMFRQHEYRDGKRIDLLVYGLLVHEQNS